MTPLPIQGTCDPRFESVRAAFAENLALRGDTGAAVGVVIDGRVVVDLQGGFADKAQTRPWTAETLVNLASTTKGFLALAIHRLAAQGRLDLDAPVARYWPEFAAAGKDAIAIRDVLSHRAGLAAIRAMLPADALYDWNAMTTALAAESPWWPPGTQHGYHAMTLGWLLGEIVRRVSGETFGRWFAREIAGPLALDLHVGLSPAEEARTADVRGTRPAEGERTFVERILADPQGLPARAFTNPQGVIVPGVFNSHAWRAAELPFANGHGTATSIARFYGALAQGDARVLSSAAVERARAEHSYGPDLVLGETTRFGLGFMLSHPGARFGAGKDAFGHPGAGGSLGFADPDVRLGFGYVTCKMGNHVLVDPRATSLADAAYAAL